MVNEQVKPLRVSLGDRSYPILLTNDRLQGLPDAMACVLSPRPIGIVTVPQP